MNSILLLINLVENTSTSFNAKFISAKKRTRFFITLLEKILRSWKKFFEVGDEIAQIKNSLRRVNHMKPYVFIKCRRLFSHIYVMGFFRLATFYLFLSRELYFLTFGVGKKQLD